jgi:hypothetical protein
LKKLYLYEKKEQKIISNNKIEMDLNDLERYGHYKHGKEFFEIPSLKVGGKTVLEWFAVNEVSYWWLISPIIHSKFKEATRFIDRLLSISIDFDIDEIIIKNNFSKQNIVSNFCEYKKINLKITKGNYSTILKNSSKNLIKNQGHKKILRDKINKRITKYNSNKKQKSFQKGSIIITAPGIYRRTGYNFQKRSGERKEFFIEPFLETLKQKYSILCIDLDYTLRGTTEAFSERLNTEYNWIPIELLLNEKMDQDSKNSLNKLKNQYNEFKKNEMNDVFNYRGVSFWGFIKPFLNDIFLEPNLPTYVNLISKLNQFLKEIEPKMIIQVYETGPYAKAFEINAKKNGIKTVGIQHGLIPSDSADYIFKEINSPSQPLGNLIPDITCVFGQYYKELLTKIGTYPSKKVVSIGNPSYFELEKFKESIKKEELLEKYSIPNKKIVLVPLSFRFMYYKNNPDKTLLDILFEKFKNQNDTIFMIRTHPGDDLNLKQLREIYPTNNFLLSKQTLIEDFILSDIVVVLPISTVSSEAGLFEKPVIIADIVKENIKSQFNETYQKLIDSEIAKLVSIDKIDESIESIKSGEFWKTSDSKKRQQFLQDYFHINKQINLSEILFNS